MSVSVSERTQCQCQCQWGHSISVRGDTVHVSVSVSERTQCQCQCQWGHSVSVIVSEDTVSVSVSVSVGTESVSVSVGTQCRCQWETAKHVNVAVSLGCGRKKACVIEKKPEGTARKIYTWENWTAGQLCTHERKKIYNGGMGNERQRSYLSEVKRGSDSGRVILCCVAVVALGMYCVLWRW